MKRCDYALQTAFSYYVFMRDHRHYAGQELGSEIYHRLLDMVLVIVYSRGFLGHVL
jgi:hypothetical protein